MKVCIFFVLVFTTEIFAYLQPDCKDEGGKLACLYSCGWKTAPGRCPQGKHCCLLKPRNSIYHSIKDKPNIYNNEETILEDTWKPVVPLTASIYSWLSRRKNTTLHPSSTNLNNVNSKLPRKPHSEEMIKKPYYWASYNDIDSSNNLDSKPTFASSVSLDTTNDLDNSNKSTDLIYNRKVLLNTAEYIKPRSKPVKKITQYMRKSVKYCEEFSKVAKRNIHAMPLLPYVNPFTIEVDNCGPSFTPLIVGGKPVEQGEFPHMAALGFKRGNDIDYLCGGSLISDKFVLTAAHCSKTRWGPPIHVHLGYSKLYSANATLKNIESIIVHPEYSAPACYHDIALIKLSGTVIFTLELRPACLPAVRTKSQVPGAVTIATGWGKLGFGRESSINLMKVSLKVIDNYKCKEFYRHDSNTPSLRQGITPSMMCASGHKATFHDTCQGDSGGPLQALKEGSKCIMEIVGITSFGKSCGTGIPAVYTRVATYLDWIESVVWP